MKWLLWKDYRVNRPVFIAALLLLAGPHLVVGMHTIWHMNTPHQHEEPAGNFVVSSIFSVTLLQLMLAFVGGNSIAGERVDRSAEFFAYMPVTRRRAVLSKLVVAGALFPLIWLPNLVILAIAAVFLDPNPAVFADAWHWLGTTAITGLTFFCVAWLCSTVLESPTFAVFASLIVPLLVWMGILWTERLLPRFTYEGPDWLMSSYWGLCLAISAVCFPAGTLYYLRRVEP